MVLNIFWVSSLSSKRCSWLFSIFVSSPWKERACHDFSRNEGWGLSSNSKIEVFPEITSTAFLILTQVLFFPYISLFKITNTSFPPFPHQTLASKKRLLNLFFYFPEAWSYTDTTFAPLPTAPCMLRGLNSNSDPPGITKKIRSMSVRYKRVYPSMAVPNPTIT